MKPQAGARGKDRADTRRTEAAYAPAGLPPAELGPSHGGPELEPAQDLLDGPHSGFGAGEVDRAPATQEHVPASEEMADLPLVPEQSHCVRPKAGDALDALALL